MRSRSLPFLLPLFFILAWWGVAFSSQFKKESSLVREKRVREVPTQPTHPLLKKEQIHQALLGDFALMVQLIAAWDLENPTLTTEQKVAIAKALHRIETKTKGATYFPQSYLAAGILLTLSHPAEIIALPEGFRRQVELYPTHITEKIIYDADPYHLEAISHGIAFVSPYSHPSTIDAMEKRGVELVHLKMVQSLADLREVVDTVAKTTQEEEKGFLLKTFIASTLQTIHRQLYPDKRRVAYLNYTTQFTYPPPHSLHRELLGELGLLLGESDTPLEIEDLITLSPDYLIIATTERESLQALLKGHVGLKKIPAVRDGHVYVVDKEIQDTTSPFILLAYFDLYTILMEIRS